MDHPPRYGRPPRGEAGRGLAAIVIMIVGVLIGAAVTVVTVLSPASEPDPSPAPRNSQWSETEVRQAAQLALDTYAGETYGDFWDLWSTRAQGLIRREDYVRLFQLCPPTTRDTRFTITAVTITGEGATVQATRSGAPEDFDFLFEDGSWRYTPPPEQQREYQTRTVDQIAQERRTAGTCGSTAPTSPTSSG